MILDEQTKKYLQGKSISNGYKFTLGKHEIYERNEILVKLVEDKKILHLGCADHINLIEEKRLIGNYLHDLLVDSAELVIGADINREALKKMTDLGIEKLFHIDEIPNKIDFDLILVPDVIEHIGNVQDFLISLKKFNCKIVITTPNAYRLNNRMQFSGEIINTDHRYWYSPYTLTKTIYEAGYKVDEFFYTDKCSWKNPIKNYLKIKFPLIRDGLVIVISQ
jgi:hypothetical protein